MNITLIYPGRLGLSSALYPPLGLSYIASYMESAGFKLRVIDMTFEKIENIEITDGKNIYGIYTTTPLHSRGVNVAKKIRKMDKNAIIVFGGPHPTVLPEETIKDGADIVVIGEGEETFLDLVKAIKNNKQLSNVKGIVFRQNGRIITTDVRDFIENLDKLPFPDQFKFPVEEYFRMKGFREISMITSRGCPMNCIFCQPTLRKLFGNRVRYRSPKNIVDEIEYLVKKFKPDMIVFSDDTFCSNEKNVIDVCNMIIERRIDVLWRCQTRVGLKKETLKLMKRAGCFLLALGVESGSQKILNSIRKGITPNQVVETFKLCKDVGILTHAYFMVGNIGETHETIEESKKLMMSIRPFNIFASIVTPYPGTDLYDFAVKNNLLLETCWDKFSHVQKTPTLRIDGLTKKQILSIKDELLDYHKSKANSKVRDIFGSLKDFIFIRKILRMALKDRDITKRLLLLSVRSMKSTGFTLTNPSNMG